MAQVRSELSSPMWREADARLIQNVVIVPFRHDVNGGETDDQSQTVDATTVRS